MKKTLTIIMVQDDYDLLMDYVDKNQLDLSNLVSQVVMNEVEDDMEIDVEHILKLYEQSKTEKKYSNKEVWEMLGI